MLGIRKASQRFRNLVECTHLDDAKKPPSVLSSFSPMPKDSVPEAVSWSVGWGADQDSVIWNREGAHDRRTRKNEGYNRFDNRKGKIWTVRQHHYVFKYTFWCVNFSLLDTLVRLTLLVTVTPNNYKYTRNSNNVIIIYYMHMIVLLLQYFLI